MQEDENRPSVLNLTLGITLDSYGYTKEFVGQYTHLNVFSSALSSQRMERMKGGEECGQEGDYLSWQEAQWNLHSQARPGSTVPPASRGDLDRVRGDAGPGVLHSDH